MRLSHPNTCIERTARSPAKTVRVVKRCGLRSNARNGSTQPSRSVAFVGAESHYKTPYDCYLSSEGILYIVLVCLRLLLCSAEEYRKGEEHAQAV